MSYRVVFRKIAEQDLSDIEEYLAQYYQGTALRFFDKMEKQVSNLESMPLMYPAYADDTYFRKMSLDDYLLFYHVDEEREIVVIHRIIHSKRDISRIIMRL